MYIGCGTLPDCAFSRLVPNCSSRCRMYPIIRDHASRRIEDKGTVFYCVESISKVTTSQGLGVSFGAPPSMNSIKPQSTCSTPEECALNDSREDSSKGGPCFTTHPLPYRIPYGLLRPQSHETPFSYRYSGFIGLVLIGQGRGSPAGLGCLPINEAHNFVDRGTLQVSGGDSRDVVGNYRNV